MFVSEETLEFGTNSISSGREWRINTSSDHVVAVFSCQHSLCIFSLLDGTNFKFSSDRKTMSVKNSVTKLIPKKLRDAFVCTSPEKEKGMNLSILI